MKAGDRVRLKWNGYPGVPQWLDGHFATVKRVMRTRLVIYECSGSAYDSDEYTVRMDQVMVDPQGKRPTNPILTHWRSSSLVSPRQAATSISSPRGAK